MSNSCGGATAAPAYGASPGPVSIGLCERSAAERRGSEPCCGCAHVEVAEHGHPAGHVEGTTVSARDQVRMYVTRRHAPRGLPDVTETVQRGLTSLIACGLCDVPDEAGGVRWARRGRCEVGRGPRQLRWFSEPC